MRHRRRGIIGFAKKPLLDRRRDLSQPLFCAVGSMLVMPNVSLEAFYALFGVSKLERELLRYVDRMVIVFFTYLRGLAKERQNALPRDVQAIRWIGGLGFCGRCEGDHGFWFPRGETTTTSNLTTHGITTSHEPMRGSDAKLRSDAMWACG